jgi:hypothetical protein
LKKLEENGIEKEGEKKFKKSFDLIQQPIDVMKYESW